MPSVVAWWRKHASVQSPFSAFNICLFCVFFFLFFSSSLPYQLGALLLSRWSLVHTQKITEMNHGELQKRAFRIWDGSPAEFVKQASQVVPWRRPFHSQRGREKRKKKHFAAGWSVSEVFGNKPKSNIISCLLMKPSGELMMTKLN